ncbi:Centrin-1 like [Heracleum sosnowskyi]|uniref:Centrin-1 like n=1 Tax=Heracleum sosnowskyi TaxID=360622 RepID=A0AAD8J1G7_9APIA|nr:Centrin-1 like [Heracleum sosnowskyi]
MSSSSSSGSETGSDSGPEEVQKVQKTQKVSDYEKQRLKRMAENKARMEAMGLHKMASSLMGSGQKSRRKRDVKGKKKVGEKDDEDYQPDGDFESDADDDDDDYVGEDSSATKSNKAKKKNSTSGKKVASKNVSSNSNFVDDDDDAALMQAIALSLQDSSGFSNVADHSPSKSSYASAKDCDVEKITDTSPVKEDTGRRKIKKLTSNRVQMTEDELILHFFQFDEGGQGSITLQDLRRVAAAHDFTWSDKEMADMIQIFDNDGDGKLSLEDFTTIVSRCQMIQR